MKKIAIVFLQAPHGTAHGREALDFTLASSALTEQLAVFFLGDGVFHLLPEQRPEKILMRDYLRTLSLLDLYDIKERYVALDCLRERGIATNQQWGLAVECCPLQEIRERLTQCNSIITF